MTTHLSLRDEWTRITRRQLVGLKVVASSALIFGSLKALGFPTWFLFVLLGMTVFTGTLVAGVWRGVSPDFSLTRQGRERILRTVVKLEEAVLLSKGAINAFIRSMRQTGRPPDDPALFDRLQRSLTLGTEVRDELQRFQHGPLRSRMWAITELTATGGPSLMRFSKVMTEAQTIGKLANEALVILKAGPQPNTVGAGVPDSNEPVRLIQIEHEAVAILARVSEMREEALRAVASQPR